MTDNWDRTLFDKDLKAILETKLPVSASKITALQTLATAHPQHHNYIVQCITRFIEKAPPDYRLAGLYVIDAISRAVHKQQRKREENNDGGSSELDGYLKRFAIVLKDDALKGCFEPCTTKDKEKVKKTLDFWEQGNVYSKDTVQYLKQSFLNKNTPEQKVMTPPPPVDTASLLATLSNIGNGTLANLNIPGLTPTPPPAQAPPVVEEDKNVLPPALAKLLGGLVSTPSTTNSPPSPTTVADPRVRNDPRMSSNDTERLKNNWPPPQGPSVPTRTLGERKSRWGTNNNEAPAPKQQDAWSQKQPIHDPRMGNQHFQAPSYQPSYGQHNMNNYQTPAYHQQQAFQQPYQHTQQQQQSSLPPPPPPPQQQKPMYSKNRGAEPTSDPSLPPGCIKVLTRTLFVGPIPDHYERDDVAQLFTQYGELASVIVSKKLKGRHNAFLKFTTRASTEAAKYNSAGLVVQDVPVKVNWAFGFGPKKHFNYDRGDSIIPLSELSAEEQDNLVTAPVGGFQGQPVRDRMVIEEPEAQYRPEWKNDNDVRGAKRTRPGNGANFEEINKKRGRFYHEDNQQQGFYQPQFQYQQQYDPSMMIPYSNNN